MSEENVGTEDAAVVRKIPAEAQDGPSRRAWVIVATLLGLAPLGLWKLIELLLAVF